MSRLVEPKALQEIVQEFGEVRKTTMDLFTPLQPEDAVIQASEFGSTPNWHIAHVTWFFHQLLNKYGRNKDITKSKTNEINLRYLNSYYQRFGEILPKSERGRYPRPNIRDTIKYRRIIEQEIISFLNDIGQLSNEENKDVLKEMLYHITLGNQHEMQHQELMIYDFQYYYQRFSDSDDNYKPIRKRTNSVSTSGITTTAVRKNESSSLKSPRLELEDQNNKWFSPPRGGKVSNHRILSESDIVENISKKMAVIKGGLYKLGFNGKG
ncbi:MAG TPA: DinB family protein, partial [Nitrososphaeraceae archaeon]|nr:DinB family protein [Nitrososphaeraceae archaeon]